VGAGLVFVIVSLQAESVVKVLLSIIYLQGGLELLVKIFQNDRTFKLLCYLMIPAQVSFGVACMIYFAGPSAPGWLFTLVGISAYTAMFPHVTREFMSLRAEATKQYFFNVNYYSMLVCFYYSIASSLVCLYLFGNWQTVSACFVTCTIFAALANVYESLLTDLKQMNQVMMENQKLEKEKILAETENEQKSLFIAKVSHELRTPLHAVICSCNLLHDTNLTKEQKSYLKIVSKSSNLLLTLINNILDISKSEAGKIVLEYRSFCFVECLEHVKSTMDTKLMEKKHVPTIELKISQDVPTNIIGDETRITQVLMNLVANGIKFHSKTRHTKVRVDVTMNENKIHVDVADTGIGIPKERQGMLFQQFVQLSDDTTRLYGGTGLGLYICKNLIETMGGRIWLKESQPGKGSVFSFEIPYLTTSERIVKPVEVDLPRRHNKEDLSSL
jgi:signal transduction histidine kinase